MTKSLLLVFLWIWKLLPKEGKEIFVGKCNEDFQLTDFLVSDVFWDLSPRVPLTNGLLFVLKTFNSIPVSAMNGITNGVCFAALLAQRLPSAFGSCITEGHRLPSPFLPL